MATIRQGYLDDYSQQNGNVGIGTSVSNEKLEIIGGTTAQELDVTGISTFTYVSGFIKKHTDYTDDIDFDDGDSGTLSGEIVVGVGLTMTVGTAATSSQGSVESLKVYNMFQPPSGTTNQRPPAKLGALFYNFDFKTIEFFDGNSWKQVDNTTTRGRGIIAGGRTGNPSSTVTSSIESIEISTLGNSNNFGDMTATRRNHGNCSSSTRGLMIAGSYNGAPNNNIEYITIASEGTGTNFGDATANDQGESAVASSTRGVHATGNPSNKTIDYVEIATLGDAKDFGDRRVALDEHGAIGSATRGLFCGGGAPSGTSPNSLIQLITIASKGDSIDFGDLTETKGQLGGGVSNGVRGVVAGGYGSPTRKKRIDFVTFASEGNATHFGDLQMGRGEQAGAASNRIRGVFAGGENPLASGNYMKSMETIIITTSGNSTFFGDLAVERERIGGGQISDSHGGLGGF